MTTVSQVRSWFDRLTTNGLRYIKNQLLICLPAGRAVRPEPVEGRMAKRNTVPLCRGIGEGSTDRNRLLYLNLWT